MQGGGAEDSALVGNNRAETNAGVAEMKMTDYRKLNAGPQLSNS